MLVSSILLWKKSLLKGTLYVKQKHIPWLKQLVSKVETPQNIKYLQNSVN